MQTQLKDVIHLYLGCDVLVPKEQYWVDISIKKKYGDKDQIEKLHSVSFAGDGTITTSYPDGGFMLFYPDEVKLMLRPLSSVSDEEVSELWEYLGYNPTITTLSIRRGFFNTFFKDEPQPTEDEFTFSDTVKLLNWLRANSFDCDGLIESSQAIPQGE